MQGGEGAGRECLRQWPCLGRRGLCGGCSHIALCAERPERQGPGTRDEAPGGGFRRERGCRNCVSYGVCHTLYYTQYRLSRIILKILGSSSLPLPSAVNASRRICASVHTRKSGVGPPLGFGRGRPHSKRRHTFRQTIGG